MENRIKIIGRIDLSVFDKDPVQIKPDYSTDSVEGIDDYLPYDDGVSEDWADQIRLNRSF